MEAKPKYEDVKKSLRVRSRDDGKIDEFEYRESIAILDQLEPSLPLRYYGPSGGATWRADLQQRADGMMTLTSGEREVDGCYSHEDPYETRNALADL